MPIISSSTNPIFVYVSIALLGGLASFFGIFGSFHGIKEGGGDTFDYVYDPDPYNSSCRWPRSSPAAGLGIVGFFLILAAQFTSFRYCFVKPTASCSACPIKCLMFWWILGYIASICLLTGGIMNSRGNVTDLEVKKVEGSNTEVRVCEYPDTWLLFIGGVMSLLATGLTLVFLHIAVINGSSLSEDHNNINGGTTTTTITTTGYPAPSHTVVQMPAVIATARNNAESALTPPPLVSAASQAPSAYSQAFSGHY